MVSVFPGPRVFHVFSITTSQRTLLDNRNEKQLVPNSYKTTKFLRRSVTGYFCSSGLRICKLRALQSTMARKESKVRCLSVY